MYVLQLGGFGQQNKSDVRKVMIILKNSDCSTTELVLVIRRSI